MQAIQPIELAAVLEAILANTLELVEAYDAHVFLYDGTTLTFGAARWAGEVQEKPFTQIREDGITYTVARSGERVVIPDACTDPLSEELGWEGAIISIPLRVGAMVIGVLNVAYDRPHDFSEAELRMLGVLADQAAIALDNAERYRQVERQVAELTAIQQVASVVNRNLETQPLLAEVVHQVRKELGYPVVEVYLVEGEELVQRSALELHGEGSLRIPLSHGVIGRVARTNQPAYVPDVRKDSDYIEGLPGSVAEIAVPLQKGEVAVGVLNVETADPDGLDEDDLKLLILLADQLSVAIENAALYERLRKHRDDLEHAVEQRTAELAEALEEARRANMIKSEFVNDISHELRTPLSNIRLYCDLLEHGNPERLPEYLATLNRETDRLAALIEDMLTISRLEAGTVAIGTRALDLNQLVQTLVEDRKQLFAEKGLSLDFEPGEAVPPVAGDPNLLLQAAANLLTNSLHYTEQGGKVTLFTRLHSEETDTWAQILVVDSGLGVREGEQKHLFERFFRGSASRQAGIPGTGLGLAIAKEVIERHGGRLTYENRPEGGSQFILWLPMSEDAASAMD